MDEFSDRSSILLVSTNKKHTIAKLWCVSYWVDSERIELKKGLHAEKQSGGLFFRAKKDCGCRICQSKLGRNLSVEPKA